MDGRERTRVVAFGCVVLPSSMVLSFPSIRLAVADIFRKRDIVIPRPKTESKGDDRVGILAFQTMRKDILLRRRNERLTMPWVTLTGALRHVLATIDNRFIAYRQV